MTEGTLMLFDQIRIELISAYSSYELVNNESGGYKCERSVSKPHESGV